MFDLEQSGWAEMSMAEAGCLMCLTDLNMTNVHPVELSQKVHLKWDEAESNKSFTIQNCMQVALEHWSKVHETELTLGPNSIGGGGSTGETPDGTKPKTKKRKKNKKPKTTQSDGDGTAATVTKDKTLAVTTKDPPKISTPSYCLWC